jgi:aspartate 1-decarboxylase
MQVHLLKSKIHRAQVTGANVNYEGSLTIPRDLMEKASLLPYERILCGNMANGHRFETYAIPGDPGSRLSCSTAPSPTSARSVTASRS